MILQKSDWKDTESRTVLASGGCGRAVAATRQQDKLPKGDLPIGRQVGALSVRSILASGHAGDADVGERPFWSTENEAMSDRTWMKLDELRQPDMKRVLDTTKPLEQAAPGLTQGPL